MERRMYFFGNCTAIKRSYDIFNTDLRKALVKSVEGFEKDTSYTPGFN